MEDAIFDIEVGGLNVTETINPILEHLNVRLSSGTTGDQAHIQIADVDGRVTLPSVGAPCTISLGWQGSGVQVVFIGFIDDVRSRGGRHSGRTIVISAKSFDASGKIKEPLEMHKDKASLTDFMSEAAKKAGVSFNGVGAIGSIKRDYWSATTESFLQLGHRISREVGGTFRVIGNQAYMWPRNTPLFGGSVTAIWAPTYPPANLLDWDVSTKLSRPQFGKARSRFYDQKLAKWMEKTIGTGLGGGVTHTNRFPRADSEEAGDSSENNSRASNRESGSGSILMLGAPAAQPEGTVNLVGVKPGVDGTYRIDSVDHRISRSEGFHTHLGLKQPNAGGGGE